MKNSTSKCQKTSYLFTPMENKNPNSREWENLHMKKLKKCSAKHQCMQRKEMKRNKQHKLKERKAIQQPSVFRFSTPKFFPPPESYHSPIPMTFSGQVKVRRYNFGASPPQDPRGGPRVADRPNGEAWDVRRWRLGGAGVGQ